MILSTKDLVIVAFVVKSFVYIWGQKGTLEFVDGTLCGGLLGGALSSNQQDFVCLVSSNT
jgi:hypothetical protein